MALRIIWSQTAVEDIKGIVEYIALDAPDAAADLADRILAQIETAAELPFSNRAVPEKADGSIREAILKPYRIIYYVDDRRKVIHVLRIWHAARGIPDLG
jgi:addiction module RelE/StbE family toxin